MRGDVGQTRADKIAHGSHLFIVQLGIIGDHHIIGMLVIHRHAHLVKLGAQDVIAQQEALFAGEVGQAVTGGGLTGGEDIQEGGAHVHALELFYIIIGGFGGVIGQKQHGATGSLHRIQEIQRSFQNPVAQVKGAVHIQHKALDPAQLFTQLLAGKAVYRFRGSCLFVHACVHPS